MRRISYAFILVLAGGIAQAQADGNTTPEEAPREVPKMTCKLVQAKVSAKKCETRRLWVRQCTQAGNTTVTPTDDCVE